MDLDVSSSDDSAGVAVFVVTDHVVIHDGVSVVPVPDLDPEGVSAFLVVNRSQHEPVVPGAVDSADSLVLSFVLIGDHQPVVTIGVDGPLTIEWRNGEQVQATQRREAETDAQVGRLI